MITPVLRPAVAIVLSPLVHVPPPASLNAIVAPVQTFVAPEIDAGDESTVKTRDTKQPVDNWYVITDVPLVIPFTSPLDDPIVTTPVLLLVQVPPVFASLSVVADPEHTAELPVMETGNGLTVTTAVVIHPELSL